MLVSQIVHDVSVDLNDQVPGYEYTRWTREQLASYISEALLQLSALPEIRRYFTKRVIIPLDAGYVWQGSCGECTQIVRVIGESNSAGSLLRTLRRLEDAEDNTWTGDVMNAHCAPSPKGYRMTGYTVNATDSSQFMVFPPVPYGQQRYVVAECYKEPDGTNMMTEVPDKLLAIVKQWVLYRALMVDSENSPTIIGVAERHNQTYFKLIETMLSLEALKDNDDGADRSGVRGVPQQARK
jgi:hypothetical protein